MEPVIDVTDEINLLKKFCECEICNEIKKEPMEIKTCRHTVCKQCLINHQDENSKTCPICSAPYNEKDICKNTLQANTIDIYKEMLNYITCEVRQESCRLNLEIKICNDTKKNYLGETALHRAVRKRSVNILNLICKNINIDSKDNAGWTALHDAVVNGKAYFVKELLKAGANVNMPGHLYKTPLHLAVENKKIDLVEVLLEYGANPYAVNYNGIAPIDMVEADQKAIMMSKHKENIIPTVYVTSEVQAFYQMEDKVYGNAYTTESFTSSTTGTHLIVPNNYKVDMKFLIGLLRGYFIVTENFLQEHLQTNWINQTLSYIPEGHKDVIVKAVKNKLLQNPRLFDNISFFIMDYVGPHLIHGMKLQKCDLITLIEEGGGHILRREPALRIAEGTVSYPFHSNNCPTLKQCSFFVIYMKAHKPELCYNMKELRHKSSEWLINCILNFTILDE